MMNSVVMMDSVVVGHVEVAVADKGYLYTTQPIPRDSLVHTVLSA